MKKNSRNIALIIILILGLQIFSILISNFYNNDYYRAFKETEYISDKIPKIQNGYPKTLLIDDMENIDDWVNLSCEKSLSTDCTQGSYSLNMTVNSTNGQQSVVKDVNSTSLGFNFSLYDTLEFDLKITGSNFTAFSVALNQRPQFEFVIWYRSYRDSQWHHVVINLKKPAKVNMAYFDLHVLVLSLWGHEDYEEEIFSILIDNMYLSSSGIRLTPDLDYKDISPGNSVNFVVELEHIHGTASEDFSITLNKNNLIEFDANLNCSILSILPNKSKSFTVNFTAPIPASVDVCESVNVFVQSQSQPGKNYSITLTCGVQTNRDRIYFMSDYYNGSYELFSMNPDGTNVTRLTYNKDDEHTVVCLSPDGTLIAFTRSNESNNANYREIWVLNLTDMTEWQVTLNNCSDSHPDFSPDGKELCFFSNNRFPGDNASVYIISINGSNERQLTPENYLCADPSWSRKGDKIAFNALPPGGTNTWDFEIFTINATDGTNLTQITNDNFCETDPYWSKDDECILYDRYVGPGDWNDLNNVFADWEPWEILEFNRTSTLEEKLLETIGDNEAKYAIIPTYSPDNKKYMYSRYIDEYGIFRCFIDDRKGNTVELDLPYNVLWADWGPRRDYVPRPDLAVVNISSNPAYNPTNPACNEITATIRNVGDTHLTSAKVIFTDGHPKFGGTSIGSVKTISNLAPGQSIEVSSDLWLNPMLGEHFVYATILNSTPQENNILNNRNFTKFYFKPPMSFILSSNAGEPHKNGAFMLNWSISIGADNYSVYIYNRNITILNDSITLVQEGITKINYSTLRSNGNYYFVVVAVNKTGRTLSNCILVSIQIPSIGEGDDDDDDEKVIDMGVIIVVILLASIGGGVAVVVLIKKGIFNISKLKRK
ncbi:MAG: hypothetical protein ACFE8A_00550 [Candidatus Hodarchaeota archaeon]